MLIRVSGRVQHLFPSDGGVITVENIRYIGGTFSMDSESVKVGVECWRR